MVGTSNQSDPEIPIESTWISPPSPVPRSYRHPSPCWGDGRWPNRRPTWLFYPLKQKKQFEHVEVSEVMGIPLVIIHFCLGFYNPAILGCPQFKRKPPMSRSKLKILKLETEGFPCSKTITNKKRVPPTFVSSRRWRCSAGCTGAQDDAVLRVL